MKKWFLIAALGLVLYGAFEKLPDFMPSDPTLTGSGQERLQTAYENRQSDVQVGGTGTVVSILADDTQGSRHQRFILKFATGQTVLIAHNIDVAPRIKKLRKGDVVEFYGEYEWNPKGGVVHWTHRDHRGSHENGWLQHKGVTYQ